jgi:hypothetical protein
VKRLVIAVIVTLLVLSCNKTEPIPPKGNLDGFLDIPWGESAANAVPILENKGYKIITHSDTLVVAEGKFSGKDAKILLAFYDNLFYDAEVSYKSLKGLVDSDYNEMIALLTEKYGKPNTINNKLQFNAWRFDNNCGISSWVIIYDIWISYTNRTIQKEKEDMEKSLNLGDL